MDIIDPRKHKILRAIINEFVETAEPVGSNSIVVNFYLKLSSATIRNDMAELEKQGLLYQPHTSSGRIPTEKGYRLYIESIDERTEIESIQKKAEIHVNHIKERYFLAKAQEKIYDLVAILAEATPNISFATIPGEKRTFYLGISNILRQPEFIKEPLQASQVIEVLEKNDNFIKTLEELSVSDEVKIFIGKENLIPTINSCSIIAVKYNYEGYKGIIGILGPMRMDYPFNSAILREMLKIVGG